MHFLSLTQLRRELPRQREPWVGANIPNRPTFVRRTWGILLSCRGRLSSRSEVFRRPVVRRTTAQCVIPKRRKKAPSSGSPRAQQSARGGLYTPNFSCAKKYYILSRKTPKPFIDPFGFARDLAKLRFAQDDTLRGRLCKPIKRGVGGRRLVVRRITAQCVIPKRRNKAPEAVCIRRIFRALRNVTFTHKRVCANIRAKTALLRFWRFTPLAFVGSVGMTRKSACANDKHTKLFQKKFSAKSRHATFFVSISFSFLLRDHFFNSFSRSIAASASVYLSKYTSLCK